MVRPAPMAGPIVWPAPSAALTRETPAVRSVRLVRSATYACDAGPVPDPSRAKTERDATISG